MYVFVLQHDGYFPESIPLTTDDLLPILVFLVVKADMPNWCANFVYMANFRFSGSNSDDEYGYVKQR